MVVNFEILDFFAFVYNGQEIDVHNNFDFIGHEYKIANRELVLKWIKSEGHWTKEVGLSKLTLIHTNVSFLNISYDNKNYEFSDDDTCMSEVTFFPSQERGTNDSFVDQRKPNDHDDIIYFFQSGHYIRVGCVNIQLVGE